MSNSSVLALEATELRVVAQMSRGIDSGPAASLFKIRGTGDLPAHCTISTHRGDRQLWPGASRASEKSANQLHARARTMGTAASEKYFNSRKLSIYGGSNEIQRNIIAKAVLGL